MLFTVRRLAIKAARLSLPSNDQSILVLCTYINSECSCSNINQFHLFCNNNKLYTVESVHSNSPYFQDTSTIYILTTIQLKKFIMPPSRVWNYFTRFIAINCFCVCTLHVHNNKKLEY